MTSFYFLQWLKGLLRFENIHPILGSLKRRVFRLNFLEMRAFFLEDHSSANAGEITGPREPIKTMDIRGYSEDLRSECISVLNSVGNLGFWDRKRFDNDIISTVDDPLKDIFLVHEQNSIVGITVLHRPSAKDGLHEVGHVAVRPNSRGVKIGSRLLSHILSEARNRNIDRVFLETDTFRSAAIKTYFNVGFTPFVKNDNERKRWNKVLKKLDIPLIYMEKNDELR